MSVYQPVIETVETYQSALAAVVDPIASISGRDESWDVPASIFRAQRGFGEEVWSESAPITILAVRLGGGHVRCRRRGYHGRTSQTGSDFALSPVGSNTDSSAECNVLFGQLYLPSAFIDRVGLELGRSRTSENLRDDLWFLRDPVLEQHAKEYLRRCSSRLGAAPTRLEMQARSILLTERLLTVHHGIGVGRRTELSGGLSSWAERKVVTKLQECLHDNLSLADLSSDVGLSPFHFSRMFKRSFGLAPHRYLIRLRVERACELLESTSLSVTEIALEVGYESSQSLARVFGAEMGMSPAAWRRERQR